MKSKIAKAVEYLKQPSNSPRYFWAAVVAINYIVAIF